MRPPLTNVLIVVAMACAFGAMYAALGEPAPSIVALFVSYGSTVAVAHWFRRYLAWSRRPVPFDYGYFLLIGWWLLIPIEAVRMHGRRGWRMVALLYALVIAPAFVAAAIAVFRSP